MTRREKYRTWLNDRIENLNPSPGRFRLKLDNRRRVERWALLLDGLAVHATFTNPSKWRVSHARSGIACTAAMEFHDAVAALAILTLLGEWPKDHREVVGSRFAKLCTHCVGIDPWEPWTLWPELPQEETP